VNHEKAVCWPTARALILGIVEAVLASQMHDQSRLRKKDVSST